MPTCGERQVSPRPPHRSLPEPVHTPGTLSSRGQLSSDRTRGCRRALGLLGQADTTLHRSLGAQGSRLGCKEPGSVALLRRSGGGSPRACLRGAPGCGPLGLAPHVSLSGAHAHTSLWLVWPRHGPQSSREPVLWAVPTQVPPVSARCQYLPVNKTPPGSDTQVCCRVPVESGLLPAMETA